MPEGSFALAYPLSRVRVDGIKKGPPRLVPDLSPGLRRLIGGTRPYAVVR
jgi:hypothetical protein